MSQISDNNKRIIKNACFSTFMIKADIRSRFPEPYLSMYCQQFDISRMLQVTLNLQQKQ